MLYYSYQYLFSAIYAPVGSSQDGDSSGGVNMMLLVGIIGSVIAALLLILIVAVILWRFKKQPRVTKENYDTQAHDNPTYVTHKDVEDPYDTLPADILPGAEGDIPDVIKNKKEFGGDDVQSGPDPWGDKADMQNVVVPAEVSLNVDDLKGYGVKYKK